MSDSKRVNCRTADSAYDAARHANRSRQRRNQLRATFSANNQIFFGRNPLIFARRVTNLVVVQNEAQGMETVTWLDPPYLKIEPPDYMPVVADRERIRCVVRPINLSLSRELRAKRSASSKSLDRRSDSVVSQVDSSGEG